VPRFGTTEMLAGDVKMDLIDVADTELLFD